MLNKILFMKVFKKLIQFQMVNISPVSNVIITKRRNFRFMELLEILLIQRNDKSKFSLSHYDTGQGPEHFVYNYVIYSQYIFQILLNHALHFLFNNF